MSWSIVLTLVAGVCVFSLNFVVPDGSIVRSDGLAYFMYAKSIVLDGDTDLSSEEFAELQTEFAGSDEVKSALMVNLGRSPRTGKLVLPWPVGAGVVMAPFYAMGFAAEYVLAALQNRAPNAFGVVPQYFYGLGSVLFGVLAFWTAFACCERVANVRGAYLAAVSALMAGPAVFYIFFSPAMAHAPSVGLVGLLTWLWLRCWQTQTKHIFWLGVLVGTITIIRYQNVIFGIMVFALLARDARRYGSRVALRDAAWAAAGALIPLLLQASHYVAVNGWAFGYSANALAMNGAGFMLLGQARFEVGLPPLATLLLSCNRGAFYWAPVMAVGLVGLVYASWRHAWARITLVIFIAQLLLIGMLRNNAGTLDMRTSFGMRYLTECSIGFAMGFAALVGKTQSLKAWRSWLAVGTLLSVWNLLLILAYVLTISRTGCVTYPEMASGMAQALLQMRTLLGGL